MKLNIHRFAINLSTLGIKMGYAEGTTATYTNANEDLPTAGFVQLVGVKSTPSLNPSPDTLETTTLEETEYKTYVDGLKDLGGALEFTFNLTEDLISQWDVLMAAYEDATSQLKRIWFVIAIPGLENAYYFPGNPSEMGLPETSVNSVLETTNYITPTGAVVKAPKTSDSWMPNNGTISA